MITKKEKQDLELQQFLKELPELTEDQINALKNIRSMKKKLNWQDQYNK
ncbi:MAG: hypothetical protein KKD48_04610 [Nanoarchaeota archaeon]|nr:hypothetical protein [Nanoarchaeota archaeon]